MYRLDLILFEVVTWPQDKLTIHFHTPTYSYIDTMNPAHHMQGYGASSEPTLAERWAQMKPVIIDLYITQDMHRTTVINIMKRDYNFFAVWATSSVVPAAVFEFWANSWHH